MNHITIIEQVDAGHRLLSAVLIECERCKAVLLARRLRHVPTEFEMDAVHWMLVNAEKLDMKAAPSISIAQEIADLERMLK